MDDSQKLFNMFDPGLKLFLLYVLWIWMDGCQAQCKQQKCHELKHDRKKRLV